MKNQRALSQPYQERTGRTTYRPPAMDQRDKLSAWFIPKVPEWMR